MEQKGIPSPIYWMLQGGRGNGETGMFAPANRTWVCHHGQECCHLNVVHHSHVYHCSHLTPVGSQSKLSWQVINQRRIAGFIGGICSSQPPASGGRNE